MDYNKTPEYYEQYFSDKLEKELNRAYKDKVKLDKRRGRHLIFFNPEFLMWPITIGSVFVSLFFCIAYFKYSLIILIGEGVFFFLCLKIFFKTQDHIHEKIERDVEEDFSAYEKRKNNIRTNIKQEKNNFLNGYFAQNTFTQDLKNVFLKNQFTTRTADALVKKFTKDIDSKYNDSFTKELTACMSFKVSSSAVNGGFYENFVFKSERLPDLNKYEERVALCYALVSIINDRIKSNYSNKDWKLSTAYRYSDKEIEATLWYSGPNDNYKEMNSW